MAPEVQTITISKDCFDFLKEALDGVIKDNCKYCGEKVTRDNFGYVDRDKTCCNSPLCLIETVMEEEEE